MNPISPRSSILIAFLSLFTILAAIQLAHSKPVAGADDWDDLKSYHRPVDIESQIKEDETDIHSNCISIEKHHAIVNEVKFRSSIYKLGLCISLLSPIAYNVYLLLVHGGSGCPH